MATEVPDNVLMAIVSVAGYWRSIDPDNENIIDPDNEDIIRRDLSVIYDWLERIGLRFSPTETEES